MQVAWLIRQQPRVLEVFETFGFADRAMKEVAVGFEACFYEPDDNGRIRRASTIAEGVPGISRFNGSVVHQGRIETWITDAINEFSQGTMHVERPMLPESLEISSNDHEEYPVRVVLKKLQDECAMPEQYGHRTENGLYRQFGGEEGATPSVLHGEGREVVKAKYVIGSDGAHSWMRKQLGIELQGETSDFVWGVLDMVPITDFPDIRKRCSIHSRNNGSVMLIPRENGMVRLYTQLREVGSYENSQNGTSPPGQKTSRVDRSKLTADHILKTAQSIFQPYSLEAADIRWFTAYQVGQRVATAFQKDQRVFIAGDACHTHSPKAGQGMNVSRDPSLDLICQC